MRERLTGTKSLVTNFGADQTLLKNEEDFKHLPDPSKTASRFEDDEVAGDMNEFDRMMRESMADAEKVAEDEQQKAREEQERLRQERLKVQEEIIKRDQEKKQKERDELMDKLKKQDEERKRRKKEEKAKKDQEKEAKKRLDDEKIQRELEEKERIEEIDRKKKQEEERVKREKEENERRKDNFEKSIRRVWNGSDVPCLFDPKIAYSKQLYSLPVPLEESIMKGQVPHEDLAFRRYKVLIIPIDELL